MSTEKRDAILMYFAMPGGMHTVEWRDPQEPPASMMDFARVKWIVQTLEQGKFHVFFLADMNTAEWNQPLAAASQTAHPGATFEPLTLLSALSQQTTHIGLIATTTTTYEYPYHVARRFASLDHLSGGRAGWNVVTSGNPREAPNFGLKEHVAPAIRYERAHEFVDAVTSLWDSWEADAFVGDKEAGIYFDPRKVHAANFEGRHVSTAGPLNVARSPQGHPVLVQAGASETGRELAARIGELVFTSMGPMEEVAERRRWVKARAAELGRDPDGVRMLPHSIFLVAQTEAEVKERLELFDSFVDVEANRERLGAMIDFDLSTSSLDAPLPDIPETKLGGKSLQRFWIESARRENMTIRQLIQWSARWGVHGGTPESIAGFIETWVTSDSCDGFNMSFVDERRSLENFVGGVVPELQRRGIYHDDYAGATLRENLGLPIPINRYANRDDARAHP